jgi:nitrite reductase/ring-hydroxylating ferredoxin subunit
MGEWLAGTVEEFDNGDRKIVTVGGREVVVFRWGERYHALENECLHMGGPVGEGLILGKVEAVLGENKELIREEFSDKEIHLVCPWHGWEYDIETGACAGDRRRKLRRYETLERGGTLYVVT